MVEIWFGIMSRKAWREGSLKNLKELERANREF
jgi:hypothetical protein